MQLDGRKAVHAGVTEQPAQCGLFFLAKGGRGPV